MCAKDTGKGELTRREMLKLTTGGAVLAGLPGVVGDALGTQGASVSGQVINLLRDQRGATISPALFGYLVEHYGRTVDAIWVGEESSIPNDRGLRLDTLEVLRRLGPTVVRYPGGTFAEAYRWQDGIGPRDQRRRIKNYFFGGEEDNQFGTDEFLRFCELVGAEAWIKVNLLTASLGDAIEWMQYCNEEGDTYLTRLRRQNGHAKPWGVKYWSLNNSATDAFSPELYAEMVNQWTFFMRQADMTSKIVVQGNDQTWNQRFLARYADLRRYGDTSKEPLFHLLALYYPGNEAPIKNAAELLDGLLGANKADIAVEEWAAGGESLLPTPPGWKFSYPMEYHPFKHYESHVSMVQALSAARNLHMFMRNAARVKLATLVYGTNTWGPMVRTDGPRLFLTPNYHVFDMLRVHKGADLVGMGLDSAGGLDVVASASKDGRRATVSLVNNQKSASVEARFRLKGGEGGPPSQATAMVLTGKPEDENSFEEPNKVKPRPGKVEGKGSEWSIVCEPFSLIVIRFEYAS